MIATPADDTSLPRHCRRVVDAIRFIHILLVTFLTTTLSFSLCLIALPAVEHDRPAVKCILTRVARISRRDQDMDDRIQKRCTS